MIIVFLTNCNGVFLINCPDCLLSQMVVVQSITRLSDQLLVGRMYKVMFICLCLYNDDKVILNMDKIMRTVLMKLCTLS